MADAQRVLTMLLTHLPAEGVHANLSYLASVAPQAEVVVCHGGRREDYDAVEHGRKLFIEDAGLRAPPMSVQSYDELLVRVHDEHMRDDPSFAAALLLEFDQLVLRADFGEELLRLLDVTGADFLGRNCSDRTGSSWPHLLRYRDDLALLSFLRGISVRDDPTRLFGCLGTGFVLRREVMAAYAAVTHHSPCYVELYVPTVVHHLGFRVRDYLAVSTVLDDVRWAPLYEREEVLAAKRAGGYFVHPYKDWASLPDIAAG